MFTENTDKFIEAAGLPRLFFQPGGGRFVQVAPIALEDAFVSGFADQAMPETPFAFIRQCGFGLRLDEAAWLQLLEGARAIGRAECFQSAFPEMPPKNRAALQCQAFMIGQDTQAGGEQMLQGGRQRGFVQSGEIEPPWFTAPIDDAVIQKPVDDFFDVIGHALRAIDDQLQDFGGHRLNML